MNLYVTPLFPWLSRDPDEPSLWHDLKSGDAGWLPRTGLSLAVAGLVFAMIAMMMGMLDDFVGLRDRHVAVGVGIGGAAWCVTLVFIWATFSRWLKAIKTIFCISGIWFIALPATVFVNEVMNSAEYYIGSIVALATGATVFILCTLGYRRGGGRALALRDGVIDVRCPECGYSLVGLTQCICPECGSTLTIDELIRKQNYRAITPRRAALPAAESIESGDCPVPALPQQALGSLRPFEKQTALE